MNEVLKWLNEVIVQLGEFGVKLLAQLGGFSKLGLPELFAINAIGATFGVLAIQTYAEVVLKRREDVSNSADPPRSRSIARLERLVQGFIVVAVLSAGSTVLALADLGATQAADVTQAAAQNAAPVRYTLKYYAAAISAVAAGIAFVQLLVYGFLELIWPDERSVRYARRRVRPPEPGTAQLLLEPLSARGANAAGPDGAADERQ